MRQWEITVYHNVAGACINCGLPAFRVPDGRSFWDPAAPWRGKFFSPERVADGDKSVCLWGDDLEARPHQERSANFDGYEPGQPLVPVYKTVYETPMEAHPLNVADGLFAAFNADSAPGDLGRMRAEYRARKLRSLSVGDVVTMNGASWQCSSVGWEQVGGPLNILTGWPEDAVTVIWKETSNA